MDFQQELLKRLDALSEKLGVTATHLWAVLVRQVYSDVIASAVLAIVCAAITFVLAPRAWEWTGTFEDSTDTGIIRVVISIGAGIAFILAIAGLVDVGQMLANPEFYALKQILMVKQ